LKARVCLILTRTLFASPYSPTGIRQIVRTFLINAALPPDKAFDDAWRAYEYARGDFEDSHAAITILRNLDGLDPAALARRESDYESSSEVFSATIRVLLHTNCIRPENIRRKLQLAITENADARDVASIVADLETLEAWLGGL
jgi:hypothetical protein